MKQDLIPAVKPTLEEIREQFIAWRSRRRSSREPIPDALWEAAVRLAEEYSIGRISKVLSLGHSDLKRRVQAQGDNGYKEEKGGSYRFVEFALDKPGSASECVIEMEDNKGGKLKVHMKGGVGFNLVEVTEAFWKRES
jgi:uncharacterized protein